MRSLIHVKLYRMILNVYSYIKVWQHISCRKNCTTVQREGGRGKEIKEQEREDGKKGRGEREGWR